MRRSLAVRDRLWPHGLVIWTDEEASAFAADLIGMTEADVRAKAARDGVDLRVVHLGKSEWHTNSFQRHGVTVTFDQEIAVRAEAG